MTATVHLIAGARPNFMKVAPLWHALNKADGFEPVLVHTGQHHSANMSDDIMADLGLPQPHHHLGVGSGSHADQTARIMMAYEPICARERPDWVVVVGDVNSTLAAALVAKKLDMKVAHLEAGLRSFDRTMPEEINRIVTDSIADLLLTPSADADENLKAEGVAVHRIARVGNIMIDSFEMLRAKIEAQNVPGDLGITAKGYGVITLHRPSNVDSAQALGVIVDGLLKAAHELPLVFPVHPRTKDALARFGLEQKLAAGGIRMIEPMGYIRFMNLVLNAALVLTDSGGIQEETSYLGIPCLTLRDNTERPITITQGTNRLIKVDGLVQAVQDGLKATASRRAQIALWDGHTAPRVIDALRGFAAKAAA